MADEPKTDPPAGDPPPAVDPPKPTEDPKPVDPPAGDDIPEGLKSTLANLREKEKEGLKAAKERDAALAKLKEFEDAQKSDEEKKTERLAELEAETASKDAKIKEQNLKLSVYGSQTEVGLADADLALAALDRSKVEWDGDQPTNVKDLLEALLESKPILKGQAAPPKPPTGGTNAGSGGGTPVPPSLTAEQLAWCKENEVDPVKYAESMTIKTIDDWEALQKSKATT